MAYSCAQECAVMKTADEAIPIDWEWHMLDEPPAR